MADRLHVGDDEQSVSVGALGAAVKGAVVSGDQLREARLEEIERRILAIEARLATA